VEHVDVFVVGGGATGSDLTGSLAGAGLKVALAERDKLGGECANYGCDPTKAMLKSARVAALARRAADFGVRIPSVEVDFRAVMARVRRLVDEELSAGAQPYEEQGARVFMQEARLVGEHRIELADGTLFEADKIVLATGSEAAAPPIAGLETGGYWTNKEAIWHGESIPESLLILGAGAIGVEFAQMYARFGSKVTLIEALDQVLPAEDPDASRAISEVLAADGIDIRVGARASRVERDGGRWRIVFDHGALAGDRLLVATGRRPSFSVHKLEAAGVQLDARGRPILSETLRTTARDVWVGGDATGELLFTHVCGYEAEIIVADILGRPFPRDYRVVPRVTYCEPEVASVGLTEDQARAAGHEVAVGVTRFSDNSRSFIEGEQAGLVKIVADARTGEILGGHIVGETAGELIHEIVAAMAGHVTPKSVGDAIHAYPTLSESVRWAFRELAEG
jgi:pyruvate/2-oxoglutarate dehydrogenase complex dihydrolipoamide dehydrogenase (E3) component